MEGYKITDVTLGSQPMDAWGEVYLRGQVNGKYVSRALITMPASSKEVEAILVEEYQIWHERTS